MRQALSEALPSVAAAKIGAGGYMVLRPDSGDPVEAVLAALEAAEKVFGADANRKGFRVPRGCGVIQGDGINVHTLAAILQAVLDRGYSAEVGARFCCSRGAHACEPVSLESACVSVKTACMHACSRDTGSYHYYNEHRDLPGASTCNLQHYCLINSREANSV